MSAQLQIDFTAFEAGERGMAQVAENAGPDFIAQAREFVVSYLADKAAASEDIVDAATEAGIVAPNSAKAWGPVINKLKNDGRIVKVGSRPRRKGHMSGVTWIWRLATT